MRLHGYCTECHRIRQVRVNNHGMARLAMRGTASGICASCEDKAEKQRREAWEARRR